jgi:hypothetical protein
LKLGLTNASLSSSKARKELERKSAEGLPGGFAAPVSDGSDANLISGNHRKIRALNKVAMMTSTLLRMKRMKEI